MFNYEFFQNGKIGFGKGDVAREKLMYCILVQGESCDAFVDRTDTYGSIMASVGNFFDDFRVAGSNPACADSSEGVRF